MINTVPFALGFLFYAWYSILTFDIYSKKEGITKVYILFLIYLYYTILAGYVISFVDSYANFMEKFIQIGIYSIIGAIVMYLHYDSSIKKENGDYLESDNQRDI